MEMIFSLHDTNGHMNYVAQSVGYLRDIVVGRQEHDGRRDDVS